MKQYESRAGLKLYFFHFWLFKTPTLKTGLPQSEKERSPKIKLSGFSLSFGKQVFKALGDESRLRILSLLLHREELSITDLELILDFTQTKAARLMSVLKNASLVESQRKDHWVLYRIKNEAIELIRPLMDFMDKESQVLKDRSLSDVLFTNRELSVNKLALKQYKPDLQQ